jgi:hypothetical protein
MKGLSGSNSALECDLANPFLVNQFNNLRGHGVAAGVLCPMGRIRYNDDMGWKTMRVAVCDVCGHRWIPETENPPNCPSKKCRSTLWNKGGIDGRTRAARIKAGRSHKAAVKKHR